MPHELICRRMEEKNKEEERKKEELKKEEEKKQEEERKRKEGEEELERKRKDVREAEEKLRQERPGHIRDLLAMDLEQASAGQMKRMMKNLGISSTGCVEKQDLRRKLIESVPELRIKMGSKSQASTSQPTSSKCNGLKIGIVIMCVCLCAMFVHAFICVGYRKVEANVESELDRLRKELASTKNQLEQADRQLRTLRRENSDLKASSKVWGIT